MLRTKYTDPEGIQNDIQNLSETYQKKNYEVLSGSGHIGSGYDSGYILDQCIWSFRHPTLLCLSVDDVILVVFMKSVAMQVFRQQTSFVCVWGRRRQIQACQRVSVPLSVCVRLCLSVCLSVYVCIFVSVFVYGCVCVRCTSVCVFTCDRTPPVPLTHTHTHTHITYVGNTPDQRENYV